MNALQGRGPLKASMGSRHTSYLGASPPVHLLSSHSMSSLQQRNGFLLLHQIPSSLLSFLIWGIRYSEPQVILSDTSSSPPWPHLLSFLAIFFSFSLCASKKRECRVSVTPPKYPEDRSQLSWFHYTKKGYEGKGL